jgi:hypothetical protein
LERINEDARTDVVFQGIDNRFWLSLSQADKFVAPLMVFAHGGPFDPLAAKFGDANGDGKADLVFQGIDNQFWLSLSTGSGFEAPRSVLKHGGPYNPLGVHLSDVNGDGWADIAFLGINNELWLSLSNGSSFEPPRSVVKHGGPFNPSGVHFADINGDGKADLVFQGVDNQFWLSLSTGSGFEAPRSVLKHGRPLNSGSQQSAILAATAGAPSGNIIQKRCLFSYDDSFQPHSVSFSGIRMKKLRHCYELQLEGQTNLQGIPSAYVQYCIQDALNKDAVRNILEAIAAVVGDVFGGGGALITAKLTEYVSAVSNNAVSCLTSQQQISDFLKKEFEGSFNAQVVHRSEWIYWDV